MSEKQPEALRLAEAMEQRVIPRWVHATGETPRQSGFAADAECQAAAAELRRLHAECEALRADAERYRWLRVALSDRTKNGKSHHFCSIAEGHPEQLDKDIDAARAAKEQA